MKYMNYTILYFLQVWHWFMQTRHFKMDPSGSGSAPVNPQACGWSSTSIEPQYWLKVLGSWSMWRLLSRHPKILSILSQYSCYTFSTKYKQVLSTRVLAFLCITRIAETQLRPTTLRFRRLPIPRKRLVVPIVLTLAVPCTCQRQTIPSCKRCEECQIMCKWLTNCWEKNIQ